MFSCSRLPVPDRSPETVDVDLSVEMYGIEMEGSPASKALTPLDPSVENSISNLWILQYAQDGRLTQAYYIDKDYVNPSGERPLERPVLSISLNVTLSKGPNSTIVIVANMGEANSTDPDWPSSGEFKWGEHGGGSLYDLQKKLFVCSLDDHQMPHLFMSGITELDVDDDTKALPVNVMLSRLASKFKVTIRSASANTYSNVRLQMLNCPSKMSIFPNEVSFNAAEDLFTMTQQVCGQGEYLNSEKSFFFYANENLSSAPELQTLIKVVADQGGQEVSTTLKPSTHGTTFRNTYYDIQISLK